MTRDDAMLATILFFWFPLLVALITLLAVDCDLCFF